MNTPMHPHSHLTGEKPERFLEFVKQVSPSADPESVMLFGQLKVANNHLTQAAEKHLAIVGLSWAKFHLLMNLRHGEKHAGAGMQPSELSELLGTSRNTVSALIASLEEDGLISRELHDTDHRKFLIRLTPEGRKVLRTKLDSQFRFVTHCFASFTSAEREMFLDFLTRLNESLSENQKGSE
jgi:DNA-binding MarR family transcriptional regulator